MNIKKFTSMSLQELELLCNKLESEFKKPPLILPGVKLCKKISDHIYQAQGMMHWISIGYIVKIDAYNCIVLDMEHTQNTRYNFNVLLVVPIED